MRHDLHHHSGAKPFSDWEVVSSTFDFDGRKLIYFDHKYNRTTQNERRVEIPIALNFYNQFAPEDVVEIGAVLPHYLDVWDHTCIDLHEKFAGVIQADMRLWEPVFKPFAVVSISTFEHMHTVADMKWALANIKSWGAHRLLLTLPFGQEKHADDFVLRNLGQADVIRQMDRIGINTWQNGVLGRNLKAYDSIGPNAANIFILEWWF